MSLSKEEKKLHTAPSSVHVCWKVGKEFWDCETLDVKEDIAQVAWERHEQQMKEWKEN